MLRRFLKKRFLSLFFIFLFPSIVFGATEDLTTFTETDSGTDITVTATRATADTMRRDAVSSVHKDYGASYFSGTFRHDFEVFWSANSGTNGFGVPYSLSNTAPASGAITYQNVSAANVGIMASLFYDGSTTKLYFREHAGDVEQSIALTLSTIYYCTVQRTIGSVQCYVFSDSGRTTLVATLTTGYVSTAFE